jgi:hypothetical protein
MNPSYATATNTFSEVARGFCSWCESSSLGEVPETTAAIWIAKLHANAHMLPEVGSKNTEGLLDIPATELESASRNLSEFNGMYYREYCDPDPTLDDESAMGDVGDDLLDIYKDVRRGLILFDNGQPLEALWYWAFLHRIHWGRHVVGALFALYCLFYSK